MDYTTLIADKDTEGSIKYFVAHREVPSVSIIESAHALINQKLRCREMLTRVRGSILTGAETLTLPSLFLEPVSFMRGGYDKGRITILDNQHFEDRLMTDETDALYEGPPTECTLDATVAHFNVKADKDYYYRLWYMKRIPVLSVSQTTNILTERYPNMLEAALKHYAFQHREQAEQARDWLAVAADAINTANAEFDMYKQSIQHELYWSN